MKKNQELSPFKYYYKELFSHYGITPQNRNAKRFLIRASIMDVFLLVLCILLCIFKNSAFVCYFTNGSQLTHNIYLVMLIYALVALSSYTIYHIISYVYERKHKHELSRKNIKGAYNILFLLYKLIHLPWILLTCLVLKVLAFFKIQNLKEYLPMCENDAWRSCICGSSATGHESRCARRKWISSGYYHTDRIRAHWCY